MDRDYKKPKAAPRGKVIAFPVIPRPQPAFSPVVSGLEPEAPMPPPVPTAARLRRELWSVQAWLAVAWLVSLDHLQLAVARGEVFGTLDGLAFLVAIVMPVLRIRALIETVTRASRARARSQRETRTQDLSKSA